jgi:hypothetical protein
MPNLELLYFAIKGRAETSRLALTIADIPFKDNSFTFDKFGVSCGEMILAPNERSLRTLTWRLVLTMLRVFVLSVFRLVRL